MAGSFDADDFMRRSLFNTIIGYKGSKKVAPVQLTNRGSPANNYGPTPQLTANFRSVSSTTAIPLLAQLQPQQKTSFSAPSSVTLTDTYVAGDAVVTEHIIDAPLPLALERTELDIYREIVCECAEIERQHSPNGTEYSSPRSPQICHHCQCGKEKREAVTTPTPTPPLTNGSSVSLEDFVKLVVTAVRESGIAMSPKSIDCNAGIAPESPEAILQRKRQQNNEAAARYRKRQRAAREVADSELHELEEKNKELKETVVHMQEEIERLKAAVLGSRDVKNQPDESA